MSMSLTDALFLEPYPFEIWIAYRTDGIKGSGTLNDPFGATSATELKGRSYNLCASAFHAAHFPSCTASFSRRCPRLWKQFGRCWTTPIAWLTRVKFPIANRSLSRRNDSVLRCRNHRANTIFSGALLAITAAIATEKAALVKPSRQRL